VSIHPAAIVHPTAVVDPRAEIGPGVRIGPYAVVGADTVLGSGCVLGPHAVVLDHVRLGDGCEVHAHAVLGGTPQDMKFRGAESRVEVGPGCVFREGVTVHRGTREGSATVIGAGCYLMANSHVGHNTRLGERVILANGALLAGDVEVGDRAFISGNAIVHQFVRIGALAMIAGGSGIGMDVPPYLTTAGVERNRVAGVNVLGLRRAGFTAEERRQVHLAFRILYREGLTVSNALERLRAEFSGGPVAAWIPFIESSRRGICPARRRGAGPGEGDGD